MMQHIIPRNQLFFSSLEDTILPETPFVLSMLLSKLIITNFRFSVQTIKGKVAWALILKSFLKFICMGI
jgi:hypothetical protein